MPQYKYYHIPGMDHLCRTEPSPVAMTQLVSVAMQFGRKQILSESFALCGWNVNFFGLRWMFQQQFAHGVNFVCPHLSSYSLRGLRKRDYPASLFSHQPWWGDYKSVNDYFARVGMLLAEGKASVDVLVVHPQSSVWPLYTGEESDSKLEFYSKSLEKTTRALDRLQVAHHYADEQLVASDGAFEDGAIRIGLCSYRHERAGMQVDHHFESVFFRPDQHLVKAFQLKIEPLVVFCFADRFVPPGADHLKPDQIGAPGFRQFPEILFLEPGAEHG